MGGIGVTREGLKRGPNGLRKLRRRGEAARMKEIAKDMLGPSVYISRVWSTYSKHTTHTTHILIDTHTNTHTCFGSDPRVLMRPVGVLRFPPQRMR